MSELRRAGLDQEEVMQEARNKTVEAVTREHEYIKEGDKEKLHNRLRRIEGQVR